MGFYMMFLFLLLFILVNFHICNGFEKWDIVINTDINTPSESSFYSFYKDDTLEWSGRFIYDSGKGFNDKLVLFSEMKKLFPSSLPSSVLTEPNYHIHNFTQFYRINPSSSLVECHSASNPSYVLYIGTSTNTSFYTEETLKHSLINFNLTNVTSNDLIAHFENTNADWGGNTLSLTMLIYSDTVSVYDLLSLGVARCDLYITSKIDSERIMSSNESRRNSARVAVGFIWFFVYLSMVFLVLIIATLQTWLRPIFFVRERKSFYLWFCIYFIIVNLVSWLGGLAGWFICGIFFVTYIITAVCFYYYYSKKKEERSSDLGRSIIDNLQNDDLGDLHPPSKEEFTVAETIPFGKFQRIVIKICSYGFIISLLILFILFSDVFWEVKDYQVWNREEGRSIVEFQPQIISKTIAIMYDFDHMMSFLHVGWFLDIQTDYCASAYRKILENDEDKETEIQNGFVGKYDIDMTIFERTKYYEYESVNDWFIRKIDPYARPISYPNDDRIIVSPADARVTVFEKVPDSKIWLKNEEFSVSELLGQTVDDLVGGSMVIIRLAPQDYHRFHVPLSGTILSQTTLSGPLYSVNADAMRSENGAIYNQRIVSIVQGVDYQQYAFVAIGATCVGSVVMSSQTGSYITKGDELGYFQFGGSTCVLVFPPNTVKFDDDLVSRSQLAIESLTNMGMKIGVLID